MRLVKGIITLGSIQQLALADLWISSCLRIEAENDQFSRWGSTLDSVRPDGSQEGHYARAGQNA